jgi:hypothetical protein
MAVIFDYKFIRGFKRNRDYSDGIDLPERKKAHKIIKSSVLPALIFN